MVPWDLTHNSVAIKNLMLDISHFVLTVVDMGVILLFLYNSHYNLTLNSKDMSTCQILKTTVDNKNYFHYLAVPQSQSYQNLAQFDGGDLSTKRHYRNLLQI